MTYRLRPELAQEAIALTRQVRGESEIPSGENGIAVDAVLLLLERTNRVREKIKERSPSHKPDLHELVRWVCKQSPFLGEKRHAYEVVVMRYYNILSGFKAERERRWREREQTRKQPVA